MERRTLMWIVVILALAVAAGAYALYQNSLTEDSAQKAAEDVAKAENPFAADNPLAEVETDPFNKVKEVLNPF